MKIDVVKKKLLLSAIIGSLTFACAKKEEEEEEKDDEVSSTTSKASETDDGDDDESDGSLLSQLEGDDYHRASSSTPLAQSFLTDEAFTLSKISLYVTNTNGAHAETINVIVYKGGAAPDLGVAATGWITVDSTYEQGESGWVDFEFTGADAAEMEADTTYWIQAWPDPSEECDFMEDASDPYADGQMMRMDSIGSNWLSTQESGQPALGDLRFRVYGE